MSVAVVASVRAKYSTPMTLEECVKLCNEVAWLLNDRSSAGPWGLRAKAEGTQWGGYAKDVIVNRDSGQLIDILVNAPAVAGPAWQDVGHNPAFYAPVRLDWLPGTTPPPPGPGPDPDDLIARVAALEARVGALESRFRQAGEIMGRV